MKKTIKVKRNGDYIKVIDKGTVMATYSKKTDKTWGATKYFKYLPKQMAKTKKVNHDYKCQGCGKPAEVNLQTIYHRWSIAQSGKFFDEKIWEGELQEMWCLECAEAEGII